jgi:hypothetical protein
VDDCLCALQATISHPSRPALHHCFKRHDISRLPDNHGGKPGKSQFKHYPIKYFHIDVAELRTEEGKLYLFVGIDRTAKFAYAELYEKPDRIVATVFLRNLIKTAPYNTILTDNGIQFSHTPRYRNGPIARTLQTFALSFKTLN